MPSGGVNPHPLPWVHPLDLARGVDAAAPLVLLYSGVQADYSGRYSFLACDTAETVTDSDFSLLTPRLTAHLHPLENAWFGYLGYGLKDRLERYPPDAAGALRLPDLWMARFGTVYVFDHTQRTLTAWSRTAPPPPALRPTREFATPMIGIASPMPREEYLRAAGRVIEAVHAGELYQANLTRKFQGRFANVPDGFSLFEKLCAVSPAPYSAYLRTPEFEILSSSPERFLRVDASGHATARPIKGSAPRGAATAEDAALRDALQHCPKNRAENLMIVDLLRNDLSRGCVPGSVTTERLFEVTTHAQVHHLSSTVSGQKDSGVTTLELVQRCFPPGSMTGAPKIRAVALCTELERLARGVYGGALGWFGGDGSCDLSVVIRTVVLQGTRFEFQVGGGIVADSTPEGEWKETLVKARGICAALGIAPEVLAEL